jgi:hypothetical protein
LQKKSAIILRVENFFYTFGALYFIEACYLFYLSLCLRSLNRRGIATPQRAHVFPRSPRYAPLKGLAHALRRHSLRATQ